MRAVRGTVTSARRISVTKAAMIMARFADAGSETGARSDVAAYLRCASAAFEELAHVHRELRGERRCSQDEIHDREKENEKGEKERKRKEKRNPSLEELGGKWKSSDLDGGIGEKSVDFEEKRDLEDNGLVLEVEKEKKRKKKRKESDLDKTEAGEEEKSESMINEKKKRSKKDRNLDNSENLGEEEEDGMKKEKKRRKSVMDETEFEVDGVGLDGDGKKRKHSEDGVVDERELHKKKKRKTKE
ncbi:hypothetical protein IHE45_16G056300 [Dioscorea alata]|uniref:Uncharacterized protein n=1 Tax=Dioscorea alata TaxID=55571 RepID=A0ACB7UHK1_DIOAL|nr:hypothetical protein IHE45_16G056300 [Dioscorea alata]